MMWLDPLDPIQGKKFLVTAKEMVLVAEVRKLLCANWAILSHFAQSSCPLAT